jgi:hypothetical protein
MPNFYCKYQNRAYYPIPKSSFRCACHGHRAKLNTNHVWAQNPPFSPMNPYFKLFSFISRQIFIFFGSLGFSFSLITIIPLLGFSFTLNLMSQPTIARCQNILSCARCQYFTILCHYIQFFISLYILFFLDRTLANKKILNEFEMRENSHPCLSKNNLLLLSSFLVLLIK